MILMNLAHFGGNKMLVVDLDNLNIVPSQALGKLLSENYFLWKFSENGRRKI